MTDNVPPTDAGKAREGLIDELETINHYEEMASDSKDPVLADVLKEVADDERVHVGNFATMVADKDPKAEPLMREGLSETRRMMKMYSFREMMCGASHFEKRKSSKLVYKEPNMKVATAGMPKHSETHDEFWTQRNRGKWWTPFNYSDTKVQNIPNYGNGMIRRQNLSRTEYPYSRADFEVDLMNGKAVIARPEHFPNGLPKGWNVRERRFKDGSKDPNPVVVNDRGIQVIWKGGTLFEYTPKTYEHRTKAQEEEGGYNYHMIHEVPTTLPAFLRERATGTTDPRIPLKRATRVLNKAIADLPPLPSRSFELEGAFGTDLARGMVDSISDALAGSIRASSEGDKDPYSMSSCLEAAARGIAMSDLPDEHKELFLKTLGHKNAAMLLLRESALATLEKLHDNGADEGQLRRLARQMGESMVRLHNGESDRGIITPTLDLSSPVRVRKDFVWDMNNSEKSFDRAETDHLDWRGSAENIESRPLTADERREYERVRDMRADALESEEIDRNRRALLEDMKRSDPEFAKLDPSIDDIDWEEVEEVDDRDILQGFRAEDRRSTMRGLNPQYDYVSNAVDFMNERYGGGPNSKLPKEAKGKQFIDWLSEEEKLRNALLSMMDIVPDDYVLDDNGREVLAGTLKEQLRATEYPGEGDDMFKDEYIKPKDLDKLYRSATEKRVSPETLKDLERRMESSKKRAGLTVPPRLATRMLRKYLDDVDVQGGFGQEEMSSTAKDITDTFRQAGKNAQMPFATIKRWEDPNVMVKFGDDGTGYGIFGELERKRKAKQREIARTHVVRQKMGDRYDLADNKRVGPPPQNQGDVAKNPKLKLASRISGREGSSLIQKVKDLITRSGGKADNLNPVAEEDAWEANLPKDVYEHMMAARENGLKGVDTMEENMTSEQEVQAKPQDETLEKKNESVGKSASFAEMLKSANAEQWKEKGLPAGAMERTLPAYYRTVNMGCDKDAINVYDHQKMPQGEGFGVKNVPGVGPKMKKVE